MHFNESDGAKMKTVEHIFQDCEDYEIGGGDLVPADFVKPGIARTWRGVVGAIIAIAIMGGFFSMCIIAGTRLWKR